MFVAIVLLVLVLGTVVFHALSPWYFTPIASNWASMDNTVTLTFVVTGLAFVLVNVFIAYCLIKFPSDDVILKVFLWHLGFRYDPATNAVGVFEYCRDMSTNERVPFGQWF